MAVVSNSQATTGNNQSAKPKFSFADGSGEKELATQPKPKKRSVVTFWCKSGEYSFQLNEYERDEYGNVIRDEKGTPKKAYQSDADGNNRHPIMRTYKFTRVPVKDSKTGKTSAIEFLGNFIIQPEDERYDELVAYLTKAALNPMADLLTDDQYRNTRNPEAYVQEKEKAKIKQTLEDTQARNALLEQKLKDAGIQV